MWRNVIGQAIYQMVVLMLLLFLGKDWFNLSYPRNCPLVYTTDYCNDNVDNPAVPDCQNGKMSPKVTLYTIVF